MKKLFYLFVALLISQNILAQTKTWTGATSSDWNTASNWSPSGVPTASDDVRIVTAGANVVINNTNTIVAAKTITMSGSISSGVNLTVNGSLRLGANETNVATSSMVQFATITNNGSIQFENGVSAAVNADFKMNWDNCTVNNNGFFRIKSTNATVADIGTGGSIGGTATINNSSCASFIVEAGTFLMNSSSVFNNAGLFRTNGNLNLVSPFNNQAGGVLSVRGTVGLNAVINSSNGAVRVNNNPSNNAIFTYQGTFAGNVLDIYTDAITISTNVAGTFTAPNTFIPYSGLPMGSQTLYAQINNGACSFVVPFTYNNLPPEMNVKGNGVSIIDGDSSPSTSDHTDFGSTSVTAGTVVRTFTIENTGAGVLHLLGSPKVAISGTNASDFTVNVQPSSPVAITDGTTTFQVTFVPSASGTRNATISIGNNDSNENPYNFSIQGTGTNACASVATSTELMRWNGSVSNEWTNACNWTPNGVPSATNSELSIDATANNPIITGTVTIKRMTIQASATLTVATGATLNMRDDANNLFSLYIIGAFTNNGTTNIAPTNTAAAGIYITGNNSGAILNNGTLTINTTDRAIEMDITNKIFTNSATGIINITNNAGFSLLGAGTSFINNGTYNYNGVHSALATATGATFTNNKIVNINSGLGVNISSGGILINSACATFISSVTGSPTFTVNGTVTNAGLIQNAGQLVKTGTFTNTGVLKYGSLTGTISNTGNGAVIVNNSPTPIFTYGGTYNGTVNGIFTDAAATTSAGTFTVPNTFTPSGLPVGSLQTLYAKITPSGGACTYIVPFTYIICNTTLTAGAVTNPVTCGGTGSIAFTTNNLPNGIYSLTYTGTGSPKSITIANDAFSLTGLTAGSYNDFLITNAGCVATTGTLSPAKILTDPATPTITAGAVTSPTTCGGANGSIAFTSTNLPNGTYSLSFTNTGSVSTTSPKSITVSGNAFSLTGLTLGGYNNFSVTYAGCTGTTGTLSPAKTVVNPASPTITAGAVTNPTVCGGTGSIAFTSSNLPNGTYSLTYATGAGSPKSITVSGNAFSLTGLSVGSYNNFSLTTAGCTGTTGFLNPAKTVANPASPTITAGAITNPTTCGGTGSIAFTTTNLVNGTYTLSYSGAGSPATVTVSSNIFSLTGLSAGSYNNFIIANGSCNGTTGTLSPAKIIANPASITLTAGAVTNPTTCGGTNGSIAFTTTNLPNGTYSLTYTGTGSPKSITVASNAFSLTGLTVGTYSNFSVTNAGCTGTVATSKVLTDPAAPTLTAGTVSSPTTCAGTGSIAFTSTNLPNGTYSLSFTATGTGVTTSPQSVTVLTNSFTLSGLKAGTYSNFSLTTLAGCTGTVATAKTLVDPPTPTLTGGLISHPGTCGGTGNIRFNTTNLPNGAYSMSFTATGSGVTTSPQNVAVSANFLYLSNLTAGTYSNFSLTTSTGCTSSLATPLTLNPPSTPTLTAGTLTNPTSCAGADGSIAFTTSFLSSGTYSLSFTATGTGATSSPQNVTASANVFSLSGLKAGTYSNFSLTTTAGCTGTVATAKTLTDPTAPTLTAGTSVNPATCGGSNGSIPFTSTNLPNGTYSLSFTATGTGATTSPKSVTVSANIFSLTGLKAGTYSNFSVTSIGCTGTSASSKTLSDPATPTISAGTVVNPATCGVTGSIPFTATNLPDGTYSLSFTATGTGATTSPQNVTVSGNAFSLTGLSVGSYSNFSLISTGCTATDATSKSIANPTTPTLVAGTVVNPSSCGGTDGAIPFTTNLPDGTYSLTYTGTGSPKSIAVSGGAFTLGSLGSGGYSNFSVTNNGCIGTASTSKSLSDPAAPVLTLGATTNPSACNLADGSIAFTTTNIASGTYLLTYSGAGNPKSVTVSENAFILTGLADGVYSNFAITNGSGCTGSLSSSATLVDLALPVLTVGTATNPTTCAGTQGTIAFTTTNLPDGTYSLSFSSTGIASPQNVTVSGNAFTLSGLSAGTYNNFSVTRLGCTGSVSTSKILVDPATPTLTVGVSSSPSTCAGTDGSINFTTTNLANSTYSLSFTSTGTVSPKNVIVTNNTFTLSGLTAGNYSNFSITNNGCTAIDATAKTLSDPPSITLAAGTSTNPTTCSGTNGSINFTTTNLPNGTYTLNYTGAGSPKTVTVATNAFSISNLSAGAYSNFSITYLGCTGSDAQTKTLFDPESATITAGSVSNPSTCSGTDGSIAFTSTNLPNGSYSLVYTGTGSPQTVTVSSNTFTLTGLSAGSYSNFSLVSSGCTAIDPSTKSLVAPTTPTLTAGTVTNPSTCLGTDGSIAFITSLPNGTYSLSYTGANSPQNITVVSGAFTLTGLQDGVYANFSIINNGCTAIDATSKTLVDPATPTLTVGSVTNPSTCNGTDGSIGFTTSLSNGTYSLVYTGANSPQNITIASGAFTLTGLQDGVYANFSITSSGCVAVASTSKTLVDPAIPTLTAGTVTNPSICSGTDGTITFITSLSNGTYSLNYTGVGSPTTITVVSGAFSLTGLSSGTYSGFSVNTNGCTGTDATAKTLTDPSAPTLTAGTVTNPTTCLSSDGKIAFTTSLPNGTYTLNYTGTGSPKSITVSSGGFELTDLPDGTFSGFSVNINGCTGTDATTKTLTNPAAPTLTAGTATNPSTCLSADGSIAFTTSLPNGNYTLNYTGTGSPKIVTVVSGAFTLTGLTDGVFSGFSVTTGGCTGVSSSSITLTDPAAPTITAGTVTNPSACNGADGSIAFTTTLPNGNYTLNYTGSGSPKTVTVVSGSFTLSGLLSGDYSGFSVTAGGCVGIDNTTKTLVNPNPPTLSVGTATNPSTCSGTGSIAFTTNLPNGTYNLSYSGTGSPKSITVSSGTFTLSGLLAGTYSNFSIDNNLGCVGTDATLKTLTTPLTPTLTIGTQTNPSTCSGTDGSIAFTTNLPNGTYSLTYTGAGSPKSVSVSNGAFSLNGLSAGTYSNFVITANGCTGNEASSKVLTDPNAPVIEITGNENLNCTILSVSRTASVVGTYLWSNGSTSATINVSIAGVYSVTVTGNNGCTATATTNITFTNNLETSASNNGPYQVGNTIELNAIGITTANYAWAGPNNFISTAQNPSVSGALVVNAGVYTVTVSTGACSATATTNVVVEAGIDPCIPIIDYQFVKAGNPYQTLFSLTNGMKINQLNDPVSIIAVPICPTVNIESLLMKIQGPNLNEEIIQNVSPYAIFDNTGNSINGRVLIPGVYTLTVTGYNQDNLLGNINYGPVITTFTVLPNIASITTPTISNTVLCGGSSLEVNFSVDGIFSPTNQFRVELSDANSNFGSLALLGNTGNSANFTSPTIIGTTNSAGIINCSIPSNLEGGTNYRIRVISTDGVSVSLVSISSITIHPKDLNLVSPTDDITSNIGTKQASNKVTASNKVSATANVNYQAGKAIILNAGFEANAGTVFKAEIRGCN